MTKLLSDIPEKLADDEWIAVAAGILVNLNLAVIISESGSILRGLEAVLNKLLTTIL